MDPITHTIIAMVTIFIAYYVGYFMGKQRGAILGMAAVIEWVQSKSDGRTLRLVRYIRVHKNTIS